MSTLPPGTSGSSHRLQTCRAAIVHGSASRQRAGHTSTSSSTRRTRHTSGTCVRGLLMSRGRCGQSFLYVDDPSETSPCRRRATRQPYWRSATIFVAVARVGSTMCVTATCGCRCEVRPRLTARRWRRCGPTCVDDGGSTSLELDGLQRHCGRQGDNRRYEKSHSWTSAISNPNNNYSNVII